MLLWDVPGTQILGPPNAILKLVIEKVKLLPWITFHFGQISGPNHESQKFKVENVTQQVKFSRTHTYPGTRGREIRLSER